MALITETGIASAASESLCNVATALDYFTNRGNANWLALSTTQQEQALRKATDYMEQVYKLQWQGLRVNNTQALDWPRVGVTANGYYVLSTIVPVAIQRACAELALRAAAGDLLADTTQQKVSTKVGDLEVSMDKYSPQAVQYPAIVALLQPYFDLAAGFSHKVVR
jgi:hypothetical protein